MKYTLERVQLFEEPRGFAKLYTTKPTHRMIHPAIVATFYIASMTHALYLKITCLLMT